jgi:hypothetical protein
LVYLVYQRASPIVVHPRCPATNLLAHSVIRPPHSYRSRAHSSLIRAYGDWQQQLTQILDTGIILGQDAAVMTATVPDYLSQIAKPQPTDYFVFG